MQGIWTDYAQELRVHGEVFKLISVLVGRAARSLAMVWIGNSRHYGASGLKWLVMQQELDGGEPVFGT